MWRRALGIFRIKVSDEQLPVLNVLELRRRRRSELFLMLAKAEGHNAYFCSGSPDRREALEKLGIIGIDQKAVQPLRHRVTTSARSASTCATITDGGDMHIVCDMLRGPVFDAGLAVAAREGVNISAGWQLSQVVTYNSTIQSVKQVTIDHTHYETIAECKDGDRRSTATVFKPTVHKEIYAFEDLPRAFEEMHQNIQTGIPDHPGRRRHARLSEGTRLVSKLEDIDHVGIAVRDLDATIAWYQQMFGAEVHHRERIESDGVDEALIKVADSYIQLLTPYTDTSPLAKYMEKNGEGIHHVGYRVHDCDEVLEHVKAARRARGRRASRAPAHAAPPWRSCTRRPPTAPLSNWWRSSHHRSVAFDERLVVGRAHGHRRDLGQCVVEGPFAVEVVGDAVEHRVEAGAEVGVPRRLHLQRERLDEREPGRVAAVDRFEFESQPAVVDDVGRVELLDHVVDLEVRRVARVAVGAGTHAADAEVDGPARAASTPRGARRW